MFWKIRVRLRRLEHSCWIFVVGGLLGVVFWDGMLLLLNLTVAQWGPDLMIRTQYGDVKAWWLIYTIMTAVAFAFGALYASNSYQPTYKPA